MFISLFVSHAQILRFWGPDPPSINQGDGFKMFNFVRPTIRLTADNVFASH